MASAFVSALVLKAFFADDYYYDVVVAVASDADAGPVSWS